MNIPIEIFIVFCLTLVALVVLNNSIAKHAISILHRIMKPSDFGLGRQDGNGKNLDILD